MAVELLEHNIKTYKKLVELLGTNNRVAIVQPTGTGKSFIFLKLIEENPEKKFLIAAPSVYIFNQILVHQKNQGVSFNNIKYATYSKLMDMNSDRMKPEFGDLDYIILDEFHRCGAIEWGKGINNLINEYPQSKIVGTSATPIRYLDDCRNMATELFNDVYAVNMSLGEALMLKILPTPLYVASVFSFDSEFQRLNKKAMSLQDSERKQIILDKINAAKRRIIDMDCGLNSIVKKYIPNRNGKYIVFTCNENKLQTAIKECDSWFHNINNNIHKYKVFSTYSQSQKEFALFNDDNDESALKLLFCIDMLNEGVHLSNIDGVIMLRATSSTNVYYQQLGRALSCMDINSVRPVIFDVVNNYENGQSEILRNDVELAFRKYNHDENELNFEIYDYIIDIKNIFDDIKLSFGQTWDEAYNSLLRFKQEFDRFPIKSETYNGFAIGSWIRRQRIAYKEHKLTEKQINMLNAIGLSWNVLDEQWNEKYELLKAYINENQKLPQCKTMYKSIAIGKWLDSQKQRHKIGKLSNERVEKLINIGVNLETKIKQTIDDDFDYCLELLKDYYEKNNHYPTKNTVINGINIFRFYQNLLVKRRNNALSAEQAKRTDELFDYLRDYNWNSKYSILCAFVRENNRLPAYPETYGNIKISVWLKRQITEYNQGRLSEQKINKLKECGVTFKPKEISVIQQLELLKEYYNLNEKWPTQQTVFNGYNVYNMYASLLNLRKHNKLTDDELVEMNKVWDYANEFTWMKKFELLKAFYNEYHTLPKKSDVYLGIKIGRWTSDQLTLLKKGQLSDKRNRLLSDFLADVNH